MPRRPCKRCGSTKVWWHGQTRLGKRRLICKACGATSIDADSLQGGRYPVTMVARSQELRATGLSWPKVTKALEKEFGVKVAVTTPFRWRNVQV